MKLEVEIDDRVVPFLEAGAASMKMTLAEYIVARLMMQEHVRVERGGIPTAPTEEMVAAAGGRPICARCKNAFDGVHECPVV